MRHTGPSFSVTRLVPVLVGGAALAAGGLCYAITGSAVASLIVAGLAATLGAGAFSFEVARFVRTTVGAIGGIRPAESSISVPRSSFEELNGIADALSRTLALFSEGEIAARQEKQRLLAALDASADGVIGMDGDGNVCFANSAAERLFRRSREDFLGKPFSWLLPSPDVVEALKTSRASGQRQVRAIEHANRQSLQVITTPMPGDSEWAAMVVFHDFTDVRRAEKMRRDFVANVSHELRTPLASIKAVLETLEGGAMADPAAARDFIGRAQTEVDRLTHMVAELLELSRIESGDLPAASERVDVGPAVEEAVERLRSQAVRAEVGLEAEIQPGVRPVIGDGERIERAVMNLVQNALKFTPSGGRVHVAVRDEGANVIIEVQDNGSGIDERDLPRIFERFYKADNSRRTVGSGLGLALVKHTAEAHGGKVSVESQLGRGSKFTISLPAADRIPSSQLAGTRGVE